MAQLGSSPPFPHLLQAKKKVTDNNLTTSISEHLENNSHMYVHIKYILLQGHIKTYLTISKSLSSFDSVYTTSCCEHKSSPFTRT